MTFAVSSKTLMSGELQQFGLDTNEDVIVGAFDQQGRKYTMDTTFR